MRNVIGMDIGGTYIRIGIVNGDLQLVKFRKTLQETVLAGDPLQNLPAFIKRFLREEAGGVEISALAIGFPATLDKTRRVVYNAPNLDGLDGGNIYKQLCAAFDFPVFFEKDVHMVFQYDRYRHQLDPRKIVIGCYIGTGIGNAISIGDQLLVGATGAAGELGHIPVLGETDVCSCGNIGCAEPKAGGKYLKELCRRHFPHTPLPRLFVEQGSHLEIEKYLQHLAAVIATEINIIDPDLVILGGGVPSMEAFPRERLVSLIQRHVRKPFPHDYVSFLFSEDDGQNGVRGAGIFALSRLEAETK